MKRSRYWLAGYRLGRLSRRLSIPSDQRIAAWLGLSLSESAVLMLACLVRALLVNAGHR
jgi:hypothetical protein